MPYNGSDDKELPNYVKKMPKIVRVKWVAIFNETYKKDGESVAFRLANAWLKKHVSKKSSEVMASKAEDSVEFFTLNFEFPEEQLVVKALGDEEVIEAILTDVGTDSDGDSYDESFLYELAEQINKEGIIGDFDHEEMQRLRKIGFDKDSIKSAMKSKQGVAKAIKAAVRDGKLWVQAVIDKRYKKRILNSRGISLEGLFRKKAGTNVYEAGSIFGFTFTENMTARNPRAGIKV